MGTRAELRNNVIRNTHVRLDKNYASMINWMASFSIG